jgi:GMP synthase-like glutamine amidotransferase
VREVRVRALVIQHDPGSLPGLVGDALVARGFELDPVTVSTTLAHATWHGAFPDPLDYDLVVSLGAIWSVYDHATVGSWIDRELDLLRRADANDVPVLGICFGGQALAAAHGGRVEPASRKEIGFTTVTTDDPDLVPPGPWMQWHGDRFTIPPGALEIARNEVGPQAFRIDVQIARSSGTNHPGLGVQRSWWAIYKRASGREARLHGGWQCVQRMVIRD